MEISLMRMTYKRHNYTETSIQLREEDGPNGFEYIYFTTVFPNAAMTEGEAVKNTLDYVLREINEKEIEEIFNSERLSDNIDYIFNKSVYAAD